jgi:hypothetical protein
MAERIESRTRTTTRTRTIVRELGSRGMSVLALGSRYNVHLFGYNLFYCRSAAHLALNSMLMNLEEDVEVVCPYCGAIFTAFVDTSAGGYATIEDCQVCCRPIELIVGCHAGVIEQVETARA